MRIKGSISTPVALDSEESLRIEAAFKASRMRKLIQDSGDETLIHGWASFEFSVIDYIYRLRERRK